MREGAPTIQHLALHLAKDAGKLSEAAEKLDHPESPREVAEGEKLLQEWLAKRPATIKRTLSLVMQRAAERFGRTPRPVPPPGGWPHGVWEDARSETGLTFYCPAQDWRFPTRDDDLLIYCPGCGVTVADRTSVLQGGPAP